MSYQSDGRGRGRGRGRGDITVPIRGGPGGRGRGGSGGSGGESFRGGGGRGGGRGGGAGRGRTGPPPEVEVFSQAEGPVPVPDSQVQKIEDSTVAGEKKRKPTWPNPPRPGYGTTGKAVLLWTNYFTLACAKGLELYRYSVDIVSTDNGREPVGKKAKRVIQLLLDEHFIPRGLDVATDFRSNLISREELELQDEYIVAYRAENEDDVPANARQYRVRIQFTGSLTVSELVNYLTSSQAGLLLGSKEEIIQGLNIVTGHHPKASPAIATVGANRHFDMNPGNQDKMPLGGGLQVIRGFLMSVRAATARILVNVQVKNMAFYEDGPLDRLMQAYITANGPNKVNLYKFVNKLSVNVTHIRRRNRNGQVIPRIKTIQGFATKDDGRNLAHPPQVPNFGAGAKDVKFWLESPQSGPSQPAAGAKKKGSKKPPAAGPDPMPQGRYITVYDFFREVYHITIPDPSLPVINVSTRDNPSYLPAVVCEVLPGQSARSKLSPAQTQQMIRFAVRRPVNNARSIVTSGARMLGFEPPNQTLNTFGLDITPKLITVPGRVLDVPGIKYFGKDMTIPRFGSWDMRASKFVTQAQMPRWTYLRISIQGRRSPWQSDDEFHAKLDEFQGKLGELGIDVNQYMKGVHISTAPEKIEPEIDKWVNRFAINPNRPKIILVVIPDYPEKTAIYNRVKFVCDVKEGILNVCVLDAKFCRANAQYMANVGLKFNLKLGGRNHCLDPSKLGFLRHKKTMVVGIDVTHPSPGSASNAPSVAGIVASVDEWFGQWPADIRIQRSRQEMVSDLEDMLLSRLSLWQKYNKGLPENILVYRDGVSEGQYDIVLSTELPAMRAACKRVYPPAATKSDKPNITIIVVGKRHNTRFYPTEKSDADRGGNPENGTVVDRGVTEARNWDFFLQAHTAIQGTARPAHYYVAYDQIFRGLALPPQFASAADALEILTHNMCYLFGRSTKAVSICPPAYYADLVCERARCYLSGLYDPSPLSSPDTSSVATTTTSQAPDAGMVKIHEQVRNSMFYI